MSRIISERKVLVTDENDVVMKTPQKQMFHTPIKSLGNVPAPFGKSLARTPGLSVRSSNILNTPKPVQVKPLPIPVFHVRFTFLKCRIVLLLG